MRMRSLILGSVAAFAFSAAAHATDGKEGWYLGLEGGANFAELDGITGEDLDTGYAGLGTVGYGFGGARLELELGGRWDEGDIPGGTPTNDTDVQTLSAMANLLFDFALTPYLDLSLGGGIGHGQVEVDYSGIEDDDGGLAYQGIAQLALSVGEQTDLFAGYRYFVVEDLVTAQFSPAEFDYETHTATIGLRYYLSPPVAPVAAAPAPVAEAAPAQSFIVFFDFNKSNLTPEADAVVAEAAAAFAAGSNVSVSVVGHTDTVGSAGYNQGLSERRAASVAASLVDKGVPAGAITTTGKGFSEPLVPTGPGVREPQNRRATIELQ
ncbi:MAG: outer membrane beta-barrel protein [Alphaproteobacteria bacterium]|nr:outer membrane beta-barrel protein [Alphaproteobacteria bacterium]